MSDARDAFDKIEEVSKVTRTKATDSLAEVERVAPDKEQFNALMKQEVPQQDTQKISFIDQVRDLQKKVSEIQGASPDTVIQKSREVIAQIEDVKGKLKSPNLEIKGSVQTLLNNKLSHIDENLKAAMNRTGSEYTSPVASAKGTAPTNPIERFLGFLTHGQYQLQKLSEDVNQMHLSKAEITPANMLAIQIKVGYVQQEVEFFTALLNKALESTKTIMNVQV